MNVKDNIQACYCN